MTSNSTRTSLLWLLAATAIIGCSGAPPPDDAAGRHDLPVCPRFVAASAGLPEIGEWRTHPSIADVNLDGLGDISALARKGDGPRVFLSDGLGNWQDASDGLDFGESFFRDQSVVSLVIDKMPVSISLGLWTTFLVYLISIPLGIAKAVRDGSRLDVWSSAIVVLGNAIPSFLFAILLISRPSAEERLSKLPQLGLSTMA